MAGVGSIQLTHASTLTLAPQTVEAPFGKLAVGSTVGANATNGSASTAGSVLGATTFMLYLNNTHATLPAYVKLVLTSSSGLTGLTSLSVGVHNGTASTSHIVGSLGSISQSSGSYTRLEPASTNRLYVTQTVDGVLHGSTALSLDVYVADDEAESAYAKTRATFTIT